MTDTNFLELTHRTWYGQTEAHLAYTVTISFEAAGGIRGHGEYETE